MVGKRPVRAASPSRAILANGSAITSDASTLRSLGYSFFVAVALAIGLSARRLRTQR